MKKYWWLIAFGIVGIIVFYQQNKVNNQIVVSAVFPVTVDAFVQFQDSASATLSEQGISFMVYSAEGDPTRFHVLLDAAFQRNPDLLISVGTQISAIALGSRYLEYKTPIIASCVSDPDKVEALSDIGVKPPRKRNVAILSDMPLQDVFVQSAKAIYRLLPHLKTAGILYNTSEINSEYTATMLADALKAKGITVIHGIISSEDDVIRVATETLRRGAELLIIPHDKYVIKHASSLSKMGHEAMPKVPVFSLDNGSVRKDGAAFGVSVDYGYLGKITAQAAIEIIKNGKNPAQMPIIQQDFANLVINRSIWEELGLPSLDTLNLEGLNTILIQ